MLKNNLFCNFALKSVYIIYRGYKKTKTMETMKMIPRRGSLLIEFDDVKKNF